MMVMVMESHSTLFTMSNGDLLPSASVILPFWAFAAAIATVFLLGGCIGFVMGKRQGSRIDAHDVKAISNGASKEPSSEPDDSDNRTQHQPVISDTSINEEEEDGPTMVLRGSLDLMASQWGHDRANDLTSSAVVEYLSPDQMTQLLFSKVNQDGNNVSETLCLDEYKGSEKVPSPKSSATDIVNLLSKTTNNSDKGDPASFLKLLSLIQKYSVNTSHPYFFNQLFGSLDPIALAAEIVALSVNTSVYTYETAPVFTLLEREVMGQIGKLVFGKKELGKKRIEQGGNDAEQEESRGEFEGNGVAEEEEEEFKGEGLMIPGGSLANLTAMHAARHRWKVMNGYTTKGQHQIQTAQTDFVDESNCEEEKKFEDSFHGDECIISQNDPSSQQQPQSANLYDYNRSSDEPNLVAFVSSEAHYSFSKSARVLGLREDDLIVIPTLSDGRMDVKILARRIKELEKVDVLMNTNQGKGRAATTSQHVNIQDSDSGLGRVTATAQHSGTISMKRVPFFVACTAGSTVRGSFDDIAEIVKVCRDYESRALSSLSSAEESSSSSGQRERRSIWVHVDGAWGGSAIFSTRASLRSSTHMDEIRLADSFTFNPHKMLGAPQQTTAFIVRHRNALREANAAGAKYLFDPRKNGAEYDLGDLSYTCGRRTDAVKLWALWKYYGRNGLGNRVDQKVDELSMFVEEIRKRRGSFALACKPWPFNVNFFYFPPRIRRILEDRGIVRTTSSGGHVGVREKTSWPIDDESGNDDYIQIPDDIAKDLANISVTLKLRLHEAGEMIIPYQPLNNQKADCFRLVLAGKKDFGIKDIRHILDTMEQYGVDL